jgi:glutamate carboxypeptidase
VSDGERATRIVAACRERSGEALDLLAELGARDAPSGAVELLDDTARVLEARLVASGARVHPIPTTAGTHLEVRAGGDGDPAVMILGHYDTVWGAGTATERPLEVVDGVVRGPGVFDMRAGVASALLALDVLAEIGELQRPVAMLLTADEETGSLTSQVEIERIGRTAGYVLIPEPPISGGGLKTRRKGVIGYAVDVAGRAAHAGLDPERGVSAVSELAWQVGQLEALAAPAEATTVNVGVISGGSRSNVVAAAAAAEVDVRVASMAEYDRIIAAIEGLRPRHPGARVTVRRIHARPPMERTDAIARAFARAREIAGLAGFGLGEGAAGGASDGNFLAPLGCAVLDGLGPDGGGAHALDEHVLVASLQDRVVLLALLIALL